MDLVRAGKLEKAERAARESLVLFPKAHDAHDRLGMVYEAPGENKQQAADCYPVTVRSSSSYAHDRSRMTRSSRPPSTIPSQSLTCPRRTDRLTAADPDLFTFDEGLDPAPLINCTEWAHDWRRLVRSRASRCARCNAGNPDTNPTVGCNAGTDARMQSALASVCTDARCS